MGSTWGQLPPTSLHLGPNFGPTWVQHAAAWSNIAQLGPKLGLFGGQPRPKLGPNQGEFCGLNAARRKLAFLALFPTSFGFDGGSCWAVLVPASAAVAPSFSCTTAFAPMHQSKLQEALAKTHCNKNLLTTSTVPNPTHPKTETSNNLNMATVPSRDSASYLISFYHPRSSVSAPLDVSTLSASDSS